MIRSRRVLGFWVGCAPRSSQTWGERSTPDGFHLSVPGLLHDRFVIELVLGLENYERPKESSPWNV